MILGKRLKELREERHIKQEDAARGMGIPLRTYCRYEYGEREPGATVLWHMADFYHVTVDYLIGRSDQR